MDGKYRTLWVMKRLVNRKEMLAWRESVGGPAKATQLVKDTLECGFSKAEKLASGSYDREISASEEKALAALTGIGRDVLFHVVGKPRAKAS